MIHQEAMNQLAEIRGLLNPQEGHQLAVDAANAERQIAQFEVLQLQSLLRATQRRYQMQQAPLQAPDPRRQSYLVRRNAHGPVNQRGLTAIEISERQRRQNRSIQLQQERHEASQVIEQEMEQSLNRAVTEQQPFNEEEDTVEFIRRTLLQDIPTNSEVISITPPPSETLDLVILTPERPRLRREPSSEGSPLQITPNEPPASTAPAALGRTKRQRNHTVKFNQGRQQGFIPESQERQ